MRVGKRSAIKRWINRYHKQVVAGTVVLLMTALILLSAMGMVPVPLFDTLARYTVVPVQNALRSFGSSVEMLFEDAQTIEDALIVLERENAKLRQENSRISELEKENERLRVIAGFVQNSKQQYLGAQVIVRTPESWFSGFTIDKGSQDGVAAGMAVVTVQGIAGIVTQTQAHSAAVRCIVDANASLAGMIERTRDQGIINGQINADTGNQLEMIYLPEQADVSIGDRVLSTGLEGSYPKGYTIGTVSQIYRKSGTEQGRVTIKPAVDFDHLEEVLVLIGTEAEP